MQGTNNTYNADRVSFNVDTTRLNWWNITSYMIQTL